MDLMDVGVGIGSGGLEDPKYRKCQISLVPYWPILRRGMKNAILLLINNKFNIFFYVFREKKKKKVIIKLIFIINL